LERYTIVIAEINEIYWMGSGMLDGGNFILMYSGNEGTVLNTFYNKQEI